MQIIKYFDYNLTSDCYRVKIHLSNLFDGNTWLGDNMNKFLNENWQLIDELKKPISTVSAEVYKEAFNSLFEKIPYDEIFAL